MRQSMSRNTSSCSLDVKHCSVCCVALWVLPSRDVASTYVFGGGGLSEVCPMEMLPVTLF